MTAIIITSIICGTIAILGIGLLIAILIVSKRD